MADDCASENSTQRVPGTLLDAGLMLTIHQP